MGANEIIAIGITLLTVVGSVLAVIVSVLGGLFSAAMPVVLVLLLLRHAQKKKEAEARLLETGTPAQATVLSLKESGLRVNDRPELYIKLEVRPPEGLAYEVTVSRITSIIEVPRLQPGATVAVVIASGNPQSVLIDMETAVQPTRQCRYCHRAMSAEATDCPSCGAAAQTPP